MQPIFVPCVRIVKAGLVLVLATVLSASTGHPVSFNTTEGWTDALKVRANSHLLFRHETLQDHHFLFDLG